MSYKNIRNIKVFYTFEFFASFKPYWPLAILYFQSVTGSYALAGSVFSIVFLTQSLLEIPTGFLADTVGRKRVLFLAAASSCTGIFLYALGLNFWCLALGAVFEGLSRSLFSGTHGAMLYESLKDEDRSEDFDLVLGKTGSVSQLALGISSIFGGMLALHSLSWAVWASIVPQALCCLSILFFREPRHARRNEEAPLRFLIHSMKAIIVNRKLRLISLAEILDFGFGEGVYYFQAAFFKMLIPEWLIGFIRGFSNLSSAIGYWYAGGVIKKLGYRKTLINGNLLSSLVQYIAVLVPSVVSPFLMASSALFFGPADTARNALMHQEFSDQQRATAHSIVRLAGSVFFAVFSIVLGTIADHFSPVTAILTAVTGNIIILSVYIAFFKNDGAK